MGEQHEIGAYLYQIGEAECAVVFECGKQAQGRVQAQVWKMMCWV